MRAVLYNLNVHLTTQKMYLNDSVIESSNVINHANTSNLLFTVNNSRGLSHLVRSKTTIQVT